MFAITLMSAVLDSVPVAMPVCCPAQAIDKPTAIIRTRITTPFAQSIVGDLIHDATLHTKKNTVKQLQIKLSQCRVQDVHGDDASRHRMQAPDALRSRHDLRWVGKPPPRAVQEDCLPAQSSPDAA